MFKLHNRYRPLALFFAFWLVIEPFAISMLRAEEGKPDLNPKVTIADLENPFSMDEVLTPVEYLDYLLELRGLAKEDLLKPDSAKSTCEAKAWSDWMQMMSNIYMTMGSQQTDIFGFYSAFHSLFKKTLESVGDLTTDPGASPNLWNAISKASLQTLYLFAFLGRGSLPVECKNLIRSFAFITSRISRTLAATHTFNFLRYLAVPTTEVIGDTGLSQSGEYFRWVQKVTGHSGSDVKDVLSNFQGVARTIGIGLVVVQLVYDVFNLTTSSDIHGGRYNSYDTISTGIWAALSAASLVCMFVPGGQIVSMCFIAWSAISKISDTLGEHNKKWKEAYKNSFWFLYEKDPAFKSFFENRGNLKTDEKCASLVLAEKTYGEKIKEQVPKNDDERNMLVRSKQIFEVMEKQGILMTYYCQTSFALPDFKLERLEQLWAEKADYMSWKPTEDESKANQQRGFFGNLGHSLNPMNIVNFIGDKIDSRGFNSEIKNSDISLVYFNPDFVLEKKYKNYLIGKNLQGGFYDILSVRIEQSPFNYIPLVGIDSSNWNDEILNEAFQTDAFVIGTKEMAFLTQQVKMANDQIVSSMESSDIQFRGLQKNFIPQVKVTLQALKKLLEAYRDKPDEEMKPIFDDMHNHFNWTWDNDWGLKTPRAIVTNFRTDIEKKLQIIPLSLGQMAAETVIQGLFAKELTDTSALLQNLLEEKKNQLANFDQNFKDDEFRRFLKDGTYLDIKGSSGLLGLDWFSGMYPAYEELRKQLELFETQVKAYQEKAKKAANVHNDGWLFWKIEIETPGNLLADLNTQLDEFKKLIQIYEQINDPDAKPAISSDNTKVFPLGGFKLVTDPSQPLNPNQPVSILSQ
ncbi:MAG: hypothetical protein HQM08_03185 [Candidatus Riflebacteria bacterium]|nr:hypothetical protein [Candidatus Riflebacteria bacterium]